MVALADRWLATLASVVVVPFVRSVLHMPVPHHKNDFSGFRGKEVALLAGLRDQGVTPRLLNRLRASGFRVVPSHGVG